MTSWAQGISLNILDIHFRTYPISKKAILAELFISFVKAKKQQQHLK